MFVDFHKMSIAALTRTEGDSLLCGGISLMTHFMEQKAFRNLKIVSKILMFVNKTMPNNLILMHYPKRELVFNKFFLIELVRYSADHLVTKTFLTSSSDWSKFDLVNNSISTTDTTESF